MKKQIRCIIGWFAAAVSVGSVQAETVFDRETVSVIQERIYERKHEIGFGIGNIPDDDFYESYPLSVGYTYHFNKNIAWEVGRAQYVVSEEKDLKKNLKNNFSVAPQSFDRINYMLHSSFQFKPTYGKDAVLDQGIVNHESYILLGGGIVNYDQEHTDRSNTSETVFSVTAGLGRRYFVSKKFALSAEIRTYTQFKDSTTETNVYLGLGFNYRFNLTERNSTVREKTDSVYRYLNDDEA